ncbi:TPA: hypothetical protein ENS27_04480 [bacterium]|jgi:hypothetical protein|nr:hypothetical protein [bacterium]
MGESQNKNRALVKDGKIYIDEKALELEKEYSLRYKERLRDLAIQIARNDRGDKDIVILTSDINRAEDSFARKRSHRWDDIFLAIGGALIGASIQHILTLINQISMNVEPVTLALGILGLFILALVIIKRARRI